ncbi:hypothetical protein AAFF_G00379940 [Aldrovandia affinis]|uniref:Uncharacterized protein n=1 Tax=Aldrovandia affinis TaxID=143900 RepID=A0AAD7T8P1_9TELE|nr:hypothetical protein AAFF_G00379940 [Aldrovandia affinis]
MSHMAHYGLSTGSAALSPVPDSTRRAQDCRQTQSRKHREPCREIAAEWETTAQNSFFASSRLHMMPEELGINPQQTPTSRGKRTTLAPLAALRCFNTKHFRSPVTDRAPPQRNVSWIALYVGTHLKCQRAFSTQRQRYCVSQVT